MFENYCSSCKNLAYCDHYCEGHCYDPSILKLLIIKIKYKIMKWIVQ